MATKTKTASADVMPDKISDWMYANCPSFTVDDLLCRPDVAAATRRIGPQRIDEMRTIILKLADFQRELAAIGQILRTAKTNAV